MLDPYPAIVGSEAYGTTLEFIDFPHLRVEGGSVDDVTARAKDMLLRELVNMMKASKKAPAPTPPLEYTEDAHVLLIDPL